MSTRGESVQIAVTKRIRSVVAVRDEPDLGIWRAQFVTPLGPSGCGTRPTLRMIVGVEGHRFLDGRAPQGGVPA